MSNSVAWSHKDAEVAARVCEVAASKFRTFGLAITLDGIDINVRQIKGGVIFWRNLRDAADCVGWFCEGYVAGVSSPKQRLVVHEYRVTRPSLYGPHTPGHLDKSARLGYYVDAVNEMSAAQKARRAHSDIRAGETLDVELWKETSGNNE